MKTVTSASISGTPTSACLRRRSAFAPGALRRMTRLSVRYAKPWTLESPRSSRYGWSRSADLLKSGLRGLAHQGIAIVVGLVQEGNGLACFRADATQGQGRLPADRPFGIAQGFAQG